MNIVDYTRPFGEATKDYQDHHTPYIGATESNSDMLIFYTDKGGFVSSNVSAEIEKNKYIVYTKNPNLIAEANRAKLATNKRLRKCKIVGIVEEYELPVVKLT